MKYATALSLILLCCSFTVRTEFISKDKNSWEIYFYPDRADSTTFLHETYAEAIDKETGLKKYYVAENLYVGGNLDRTTGYSFRNQDTSYFEKAYFSNGQSEEKYYSALPSINMVTLNDSTEMDVSYFKDGTFKRIEVRRDIRNFPLEETEWDSLHEYSWHRMYKSVRWTDTATKDMGDEIQMIVTQHEDNKKCGTWKKYNRSGKVIDRVVYK